MRIVSLSSIPPRFGQLGPVLESLLAQRPRVDAVQLHVPRRYRRFPDYDGTPPSVPDGVTLVRPDEDLGPASKVLFAARALRGTDTQILFCDDDKLFSPDWGARLFDEQAARPDMCVALAGKHLPKDIARTNPRTPRAVLGGGFDPAYEAGKLLWRAGLKPGPRPTRRAVREAGFADILQGLGGVVVRPDFFDDEAFDIPDILWAVDDVWLSGMLERRGIPIWLPAGLRRPAPLPGGDGNSLYEAVIDGVKRDDANRRCIEHLRERYGIWR